MKNQIITYILISILIFGCRKDSSDFNPTNPFQNIITVNKQIFDLDTLSKTEIKGDKGTIIYYNREDFNISDDAKLTLELKEYYNRLELISDNLNTVTNKNELLESSGVVYINIKNGNQDVKLKKDKKLKIKFKNRFKKGDRIYNGEFDTFNQIRWVENKEATTIVSIIDSISSIQFDILSYKDKIIPVDSLEYYPELNPVFERDMAGKLRESDWAYYPPIFIDNLGWINVDRIVKPDAIISYELNLNQTGLENVTTFLIYKDLNAFISDYRWPNDLKFTEIPLKNKTSLVVIAVKNKLIYANKINLSKNSNGKLDIALKKTDSIELEKLLKK